MTDPFAIALAALFRAPGSMAATYTPKGGAAIPIRVIRNQGSDVDERNRRVADTNSFDVLRSDVPSPARGDLITVADPASGEPMAFAIDGGPVLDVEGLTWTCPTQPR